VWIDDEQVIEGGKYLLGKFGLKNPVRDEF
jgi:hypothetical protein